MTAAELVERIEYDLPDAFDEAVAYLRDVLVGFRAVAQRLVDERAAADVPLDATAVRAVAS